ncbi:MAG: GvpL/GvpF family gas vesicle protein [Patescibacteria group bacterium]
MGKEMGKYIYCVIKKPRESFNVEFCGVGGGKLYVINSGELAAIVSDSPVMDYPITRENTITHQRAIEEVMRANVSVLPVSFGTVAENQAVVEKKLLESKQSELLDALERVEGKVELNLKAIWLDMPSTFQKVVAENPNLALLKKEFAGSRLGMATTIEIGKLVEDGLQTRRNKIREEILSLFEDIVVDHKDTPRLGEQMIFNIAVLIPQAKQKVFDKTVRDLDEEYKNENAYFKYIGPMPPFNFVKVLISFV